MIDPKKLPKYQQYKGLATMDTITPSYGTGPYYITHISPPHHIEDLVGCMILRDWEVVSFGVHPVKNFKGLRKDNCYALNCIRFENGVYISDQGDTYTIEKTSLNFDMIRTPNSVEPKPTLPYPYKDYIDYSKRGTWLCENCGNEFNKELQHTLDRYCACFFCGHGCTQLIRMRPRDICKGSAYVLMINGGYLDDCKSY